MPSTKTVLVVDHNSPSLISLAEHLGAAPDGQVLIAHSQYGAIDMARRHQPDQRGKPTNESHHCEGREGGSGRGERLGFAGELDADSSFLSHQAARGLRVLFPR